MSKVKLFASVPDFSFDPQKDRDILLMSGYARLAKAANKELQIILMQNNPLAFLQNPIVDNLLAEKGDDALPIMIKDDELLLSGRYPDKNEMETAMAMTFLPVNVVKEANLQKALTDIDKVLRGNGQDGTCSSGCCSSGGCASGGCCSSGGCSSGCC